MLKRGFIWRWMVLQNTTRWNDIFEFAFGHAVEVPEGYDGANIIRNFASNKGGRLLMSDIAVTDKDFEHNVPLEGGERYLVGYFRIKPGVVVNYELCRRFVSAQEGVYVGLPGLIFLTSQVFRQLPIGVYILSPENMNKLYMSPDGVNCFPVIKKTRDGLFGSGLISEELAIDSHFCLALFRKAKAQARN